METSNSLRTCTLAFYETLIATLPPRTVSDRTCFRRVAAGPSGLRGLWRGVFQKVLVFAREARGPGYRNPHAVFMSILQKELHYELRCDPPRPI